MARVIIDTGPLIALAKVDQTELFHKLFDEICITASVKAECMVKPCAEHEVLADLMQKTWLNLCSPVTCDQLLSLSLGRGEQDSIHLTLEDASNSLLIMDDFLARKQALRLGLHVIGTVRLLDIAEQRGLIRSAESMVLEMRDHGYRISMAILEHIRSERD
ncbi:MAG: DUF3368 domain-containing protein [Mariprofundus sp.]|nr:DUF3368 domain-containing protein [Mariprofundus sp.]